MSAEFDALCAAAMAYAKARATRKREHISMRSHDLKAAARRWRAADVDAVVEKQRDTDYRRRYIEDGIDRIVSIGDSPSLGVIAGYVIEWGIGRLDRESERDAVKVALRVLYTHARNDRLVDVVSHVADQVIEAERRQSESDIDADVTKLAPAKPVTS